MLHASLRLASPLVIGVALLAGCSSDGTGTSAAAGGGGSDPSGPSAGTGGRGEGGDADGEGGDGSNASGPGGSGPASTGNGPVGSSSSGGEGGAPSDCKPQMDACADVSECCPDLRCDETSLGQVCCGGEGIPCATEGGEDCCGSLLCVDGVCGWPIDTETCEPACTEAPALVLEKRRLNDIGGTFLGICGDANHTYGFHVPAANLPADDYSMEGEMNDPICEWHACAIDVGMDWPVSRDWLRWLIEEIAADRITGIYEVIGSYDGIDVRYWSDWSGWEENGIEYTGAGHDTHTHVSIYRATALDDHGILAGWTWDAPPP
jgi:hypothetical protein